MAIPVLILINGLEMGKVEQKENEQLVEQLRKRDQALAELSQLAVTLNETQKLKPAFAYEPIDQLKYDQMRFSFEQGVDRMKKLYYTDTALYRANHDILSFLEANYKSYNRISDEFRGKVREEVARNASPGMGGAGAGASGGGGGGGGGGSSAQVAMLERDLNRAERTIERLEAQLASRSGSSSAELQQIRENAMALEENLDQISVVLTGIEEDCNGIQRRGDNNLRMKNKILERVKFLKSHLAGIRNSNNNMLGMLGGE
ncbi:hypothetical protein [Sabulibacter ruber]|uniref:hypothetical protein n=1 Tax=Sabulibacter ruber TaxID=2811901 RepID=UPI001A95C126|nr:hypothetical protein [Sabulibacter ruber]